MSNLKIYHNPRCSKSRQTLELLNEKNAKPEVVEYLTTPPSVAELQDIVQKLSQPAKAILRTKEEEFKALDVDINDDKQILEAIATHPKLLERPIVVKGNKAAIGRPPENVLTIL